jgi:magnesium chelatase subunit I
MVLRHRLRRNPLDDTGSSVRVQRAMDEVLGAVSGSK